MAGCSNEQFQLIQSTIEDGGFQSTKKTFVQTVCQNFTFTAQQVGALLNCFDFSSDKLEAVDLFAGCTIDPSNVEPITAAFDDDDEKAAVAAKVAAFKATPAREIAPLRVENDGHRSQQAMERLFATIDAATMSSDKVAALHHEITHQPSPPFNYRQLCEILEKFSFSSDKEKVLHMFVGPQIVYPMLCTQVVEVLDSFSMSSDKIAILPALKPFIYDRQNKLTIVASFSFSSDKAKAEEILRDLVVDFRPKTPPAAQIQAALRAVGRCPAGYDWRKVQGGWRCAAGGHYVGDAQLEKYFQENV